MESAEDPRLGAVELLVLHIHRAWRGSSPPGPPPDAAGRQFLREIGRPGPSVPPAGASPAISASIIRANMLLFVPPSGDASWQIRPGGWERTRTRRSGFPRDPGKPLGMGLPRPGSPVEGRREADVTPEKPDLLSTCGAVVRFEWPHHVRTERRPWSRNCGHGNSEIRCRFRVHRRERGRGDGPHQLLLPAPDRGLRVAAGSSAGIDRLRDPVRQRPDPRVRPHLGGAGHRGTGDEILLWPLGGLAMVRTAETR